MNYRHAFHAGNFADVMKHAVFVWIIAYLQKKPAPIRVVDTHAGTGRYDLGSSESARTGEWRQGIGRLIADGTPALEDDVAPLLGPYLDLVRRCQLDGADRHYPGSPDLARRMLRPGDCLQVNEAHPDDLVTLSRAFARDPQVTVMGRDGYDVLKSALPPKERRGIVLIDPPFEAPDEFQRLERGVRAALDRFANGTYLIWYPVKDPRNVGRWLADMAGALPSGALVAELDVGRAPGATGLHRAGLLIINPPFGLRDILTHALPPLARRLGQGQNPHAQIADIPPTGADGRPR